LTPSPQEALSLRSAQALSRRERGFCDTLCNGWSVLYFPSGQSGLEEVSVSKNKATVLCAPPVWHGSKPGGAECIPAESGPGRG